MESIVDDSLNEFCNEILGLEVKKAKSLGKNFYVASIPIYENKQETNWFFFFKRDTLNEIAKILLFEDNLSEDDINDLLKEVSNQVIGLAKVKLEENYQNNAYKLGTPEFLGKISSPFPIELEKSLLYKINNRTFLVAKEKNQQERVT
ncbi:MAG: chemotaxis protein CheX [Epsilonproteobacteria bacterium]|nr:chemotaxis protein CheX [Campylobacterota bacterium]